MSTNITAGSATSSATTIGHGLGNVGQEISTIMGLPNAISTAVNGMFGPYGLFIFWFGVAFLGFTGLVAWIVWKNQRGRRKGF